ncbi:MAG: RNA polymerase sigma factor [Thermoleophilaceae bacterium]
MPGTARGTRGTHVTTYCVVPRPLADELHDSLREHFRGNADVRVVVEFRSGERRKSEDRRAVAAAAAAATEEERRRIRSETGRRVADRRAVTVPVEAPTLPRRFRRHADDIRFYERIEPNSQRALDADNARLVMRFQQGDKSAFTDLYMRNFDSVYTYLKVALKDHHEAEDAAQQVFINTLEALPRFELRRGKPFRAWLFRITRNQALSHLRKHRVIEVEDPAELTRRRRGDTEVEAEKRALDWLSDSDLLILIERLPVAQRQALTLRYMLGLTTDEMATVLGRTTMAVRKLEHRALRFLEQRLVATGRKPLDPERMGMVVDMNRGPVTEARKRSLGTARAGAGRPHSGVR